MEIASISFVECVCIMVTSICENTQSRICFAYITKTHMHATLARVVAVSRLPWCAALGGPTAMTHTALTTNLRPACIDTGLLSGDELDELLALVCRRVAVVASAF